MPWGGSILVMSVWCPGGFLNLNGHLFLMIWENFWDYFIEYITYTFGLHLFSLFDAHDSQVLSFGGIAEFLYIAFATLESFV
jgi:hypothetical protein